MLATSLLPSFILPDHLCIFTWQSTTQSRKGDFQRTIPTPSIYQNLVRYPSPTTMHMQQKKGILPFCDCFSQKSMKKNSKTSIKFHVKLLRGINHENGGIICILRYMPQLPRYFYISVVVGYQISNGCYIFLIAVHKCLMSPYFEAYPQLPPLEFFPLLNSSPPYLRIRPFSVIFLTLNSNFWRHKLFIYVNIPKHEKIFKILKPVPKLPTNWIFCLYFKLSTILCVKVPTKKEKKRRILLQKFFIMHYFGKQ